MCELFSFAKARLYQHPVYANIPSHQIVYSNPNNFCSKHILVRTLLAELFSFPCNVVCPFKFLKGPNCWLLVEVPYQIYSIFMLSNLHDLRSVIYIHTYIYICHLSPGHPQPVNSIIRSMSTLTIQCSFNFCCLKVWSVIPRLNL